MRLTEAQSTFFETLGFDVWKTKAEFWPDLPELIQGHILAQIYEARLVISTMRGRYGQVVISIPPDSSPQLIAVSMLVAARQPETDHNKDLRLVIEKTDLMDKLEKFEVKHGT